MSSVSRTSTQPERSRPPLESVRCVRTTGTWVWCWRCKWFREMLHQWKHRGDGVCPAPEEGWKDCILYETNINHSESINHLIHELCVLRLKFVRAGQPSTFSYGCRLLFVRQENPTKLPASSDLQPVCFGCGRWIRIKVFKGPVRAIPSTA
jgi:hypothetical protein